MNKFALPDSVAPSEADYCNIVPSTTLRFGFDYCHHVMEKTENEIQNEDFVSGQECLDSSLENVAEDDKNFESCM